jgi:hypothetical protein
VVRKTPEYVAKPKQATMLNTNYIDIFCSFELLCPAKPFLSSPSIG